MDPSPIKRKSEGGVVSPRPNNSQPLFAYENELRRKDEEYKYIEQITNIIEGNIDVDKFLVKEKEELKCSSDSDNQSIISIADSNASNRSGPWSEFVMVSDTDADVKKEPQAESVAQKDDDNNNNNNVTVEEVKECPVKDVPLDLSQNIAVEEAAAVEEIKEKTGKVFKKVQNKFINVIYNYVSRKLFLINFVIVLRLCLCYA